MGTVTKNPCQINRFCMFPLEEMRVGTGGNTGNRRSHNRKWWDQQSRFVGTAHYCGAKRVVLRVPTVPTVPASFHTITKPNEGAAIFLLLGLWRRREG
jgi:hypothetical protein